MRKILLGFIAFALLGMSLTASAALPRRKGNVDYGSGIWGGPGAGVVQDAGWADPNLQVGMVGDSITNLCQHDLRAAFAVEGVSFAIKAHSGQNTAGTNTWLESLTYMPDRLIMAAGTNDVFNPFAMPAQIARTKTAIGLAELFWVDTYVGRPITMADDIRNSGQVNDYIHAAIPADHAVDWVANLTSTRGRGLTLSYYLKDGVHPWVDAEPGHGDGCANFAATVLNTVRPLL